MYLISSFFDLIAGHGLHFLPHHEHHDHSYHQAEEMFDGTAEDKQSSAGCCGAVSVRDLGDGRFALVNETSRRNVEVGKYIESQYVW
jgi:hypothetical protein